MAHQSYTVLLTKPFAVLLGLLSVALAIQFSILFTWFHGGHHEMHVLGITTRLNNEDIHPNNFAAAKPQPPRHVLLKESINHMMLDRGHNLKRNQITSREDFLNYEVSKRKNEALNAVIHIGPYKTATTAIQTYSSKLVKLLAQDGYEMPWSFLKKEISTKKSVTNYKIQKVASWWCKQTVFATCFFQNVPLNRMLKESADMCEQEIYDAGIEIVKQNNNSLLVSAEQFSNIENEGVEALKEYLANRWDNVTIVATYRRYYEWIVSFYHERYKDVNLYDAARANETERLFPSLYHELHFNHLFNEAIQHTYTLSAVARFKKHFRNVVVMNYHDESKSLLVRFYCDVLPNAPNTCRTLKTMKESKAINRSQNRIYEELAYTAHRRGMINIKSRKMAKLAEALIRQHQEETLKLTNDDFPRTCLPEDILQDIWNTSIEAEKEFGGEGDDSMKDDFDKCSKTSFCEVDLGAVLDSPRWVEYFQGLQVELDHITSLEQNFLTYDVSKHRNEALNAVIHIGPYKTATTAIQTYSSKLVKLLAQDGYEMPWSFLKKEISTKKSVTNYKIQKVASWWCKQTVFATCFFQNVPSNRMLKESADMCEQEIYDAGIEIVKQNNNSLLVSAEQFSNIENEGVEALKEYLANRWDNVTIVATYRRYYEWIVSFYHERYKDVNLYDAARANETERLFPSLYHELHFNHLFNEAIQHTYTLSAVARFKKHFRNVVVMNYHDESKSLLVRFYCDVLPNAPNTCRTLKIMEESKAINRSQNRIYEELAYTAHRRGMINIKSRRMAKLAEALIRQHQEETLKLTNDDFPRTCLPEDILQDIWNTSIEAEKEFGGEGDDSMKDDFDKCRKTSFCEVDLGAVLDSPRWVEYFQGLQVELERLRLVRSKV